MPSRFLVLQHIACEHPGAFRPLMEREGIVQEVVEVDEGEPIPDPTEFDALLVFGGPMNVDEEAEHPWLVDEKLAIERAVRAGVPYLGMCFGAQLLARCLGARVYPATRPEVGVLDVRLTDAAERDPLFSRLPDPLPCFQWHGDTFDLPPGATLLASSDVCPNQAFRWGRAAYGIQFHVEVTDDMAQAWSEIPAYQASAQAVRGPQGLHELRRELEQDTDAFAGIAAELFGGFQRVVDAAGTAQAAHSGITAPPT
jgi:GMP synthase-like glutamine amidotransferase